MDTSNWVGLIAIPLAYIGGMATLALSRPTLCIRLSKFLGSVAITMATVFLGATIGAFSAQQAIIRAANDTYAADFAITDGQSQYIQETEAGTAIVERIARSIDPALKIYLFWLATSGFVILVSVCATLFARMVIEDRDSEAANTDPKRKPRKSSGNGAD